MIEISFSTNEDASRVDIFQRPAANGGYYETMKSGIYYLISLLCLISFFEYYVSLIDPCSPIYIVVQEVVNFNKATYGYNFATQIYINNAQQSANYHEGNNNYRRAWEQYRLMYRAAIFP